MDAKTSGAGEVAGVADELEQIPTRPLKVKKWPIAGGGFYCELEMPFDAAHRGVPVRWVEFNDKHGATLERLVV